LLVVAFCISFFTHPVAADQQPFEVTAPSALLIDNATGTVMYEKNADIRRPIASITKIMTLCIVFEEIESGRLKYTDKIPMSETAKVGGSHVYTDVGHEYTVEDLIKSVIIASANDCCVLLAEHIAGAEEVFVQRMNIKAKQWGMNNTNFANCTGMPAPNSYSTARDIAIMSRELVKHKDFFRWSSIWMDEIKHKNGRVTELTNTNRLVRFYDGCDGLKTGYTSEAMHCISATAIKNGLRLIAVVLGDSTSTDRFETAKKLMNYGFANYESKLLAKTGEVVENEIKVLGSKIKTIKTVVKDDVSFLMKKSEQDNITKHVQLPETVTAPIKKGENLGQIIFKKNGLEIARTSVIAAEGISRATFWDYFKMLIKKWLGRK
ncbi:MAG TPA: D-alanyl-D-alanine carboxypeptidase family protein, partial [Clostridia bacterium]|nr:D-alanyl-D-alanine carboxypeptidase family protein [Clostridia bacterium]